jgi:hypothetical protein
VLSCASASTVELSGVSLGEGSAALATTLVVFATRLLNAGHPPQASVPPAPLHCPPPGHEPEECSGGLYDPDVCREWLVMGESAEGDGLRRRPRLPPGVEIVEAIGFLKLFGLD